MLPLLTQSLLSHTSRCMILLSSAKPSCVPIQTICDSVIAVAAAIANVVDAVFVALFLFNSENRAILRGWFIQNATEVLHLKCVFVCSQVSKCTYKYIHRELDSLSWRVGRIQCEENCSVVWWSHFYWFSIFSKDLCFMNAFTLFLLQSFVLFHHLQSEFIFFPRLNCCW